MYDPTTARFIQEDTYAGTLDNPLSQNRYSYVMNNPVNYWDPTGRVPQAIPDEVYQRANFTRMIDASESRFGMHEMWNYEFQSYDSQTVEDNFRKVTGAREITTYWDETTTKTWYYEAVLSLLIDPVDYTATPGHLLPKSEEFREVTTETKSRVITAEQLLKSNYEILKNYKEVPAGSAKLGKTTTHYLNGEEITEAIYTSGTFNRYRMLRAATGPTPSVASYQQNLTKPTVKLAKPKEEKKGFFSKVGGFFKSTADFLFLDDIKTLTSPDTSLLEKGLAATSFIPVGKVVKGAKLGLNQLPSAGRKTSQATGAVKRVDGRDVTK
ncbi:RHS repeat-associated core domain-containing protein, partial [Ornithinibacillus massiliensis]